MKKSKHLRKKLCCVLRQVQLFVIPWTVASQAPLSMEFSRQEYCSGLPFPPPGTLLNPGIEPVTSASHRQIPNCATKKK